MPRKPRFDAAWKRRRKSGQQLRGAWQKVLAVLLVCVGVYWLLQPTAPPPDSIAIRQPFTLCSARTTGACVIDGDTIMLGRRKIRMQGYNSPEMAGACAAETVLALQARGALLAWLNDSGVRMDGDADMTRDQYGRELRRFWRIAEDGDAEWLADHMVDAGLARGEWDWSRDWC